MTILENYEFEDRYVKLFKAFTGFRGIKIRRQKNLFFFSKNPAQVKECQLRPLK